MSSDQVVRLDDGEWQTVISIISTAPWRDANPLLMKIGQQLRMQQDTMRQDKTIKQSSVHTDGKEARDG
jgi:hypothetical protein